jgi:urease accessory protein UreH
MLQEQLDSALDWMNLADHFATTLVFENQALTNKMDEVRQQLRHVEGTSVNAIKMEEELLEARALVTTYEVMEDNTLELERQNRNLKKCLTKLAGEYHTYRDCTVFAVARAR